MKRILLVLVGVVIGALATGAVLNARAGAGGGDPTYAVAGTATTTNNVSACSAIGGGGGRCTSKVSGDYFTFGVLGSGKYAGTLTIDWSTYAVNPGANNEMCANISGPMTFTTGSSVLKVNVVAGSSFSYSYMCETPGTPVPFDRNYLLYAQVVSGTGKFKHVIPSESFVVMGGNQFAQINAALSAPSGRYLDSPSLFPSLDIT